MATKLKQPEVFGFDPPHGTVFWLRQCIERGKIAPFYDVITLNPALAEVMLTMNDKNRPITQSRVDRYVADMKAGRWQFNGEPILFSDNGNLNDGQHRCKSLVQAGVSIPVSIGFGFSEESRLTTDQGGAKTAAAFAGMTGQKDAAIAAGCARLLIAFDGTRGQSISNASKLTNAEVLRRILSDDNIAVAAAFAAGGEGRKMPFIAPSVAAFCYYVLARISEEDAKVYLHQVATGEGLKAGSPALTVRNRLIAEGRAPKSLKIEILLRGWVAFRKGISLARSQTHEVFPELR